MQLFLGGEQLFFTGTGTVVVDSREDAFFSNFTGEMQFHVTGPFKLFVNYFVHLRAGVDKRGCDDSQATTLFHVTCRTEEAFRTMQGIRIHTTGQYFTGGRNHGVVGTSQTSNGVQQDDNVFFMLNQTFGFFDNHLSNLHMAGGWLIKGRRNNFAFNQTLHLGNFFRTFVDQQYHQHTVRMVVSNALGNVLQQHGFTRFRRCHNQTTLATTDR